MRKRSWIIDPRTGRRTTWNDYHDYMVAFHPSYKEQSGSLNQNFFFHYTNNAKLDEGWEWLPGRNSTPIGALYWTLNRKEHGIPRPRLIGYFIEQAGIDNYVMTVEAHQAMVEKNKPKESQPIAKEPVSHLVQVPLFEMNPTPYDLR